MGRGRARRWVLWWFLAWCCLYLAVASGRISHGDDETRFQVTQNLVERGTLRIDHRMVAMPAMPLAGLLPREGYTFATTMPLASPCDGALYSRYSPGQSFLTVPLYLLGRVVASLAWPEAWPYLTRFVVALWNALWSAAAVACISAFLARLGYRRGTALLGGVAYGLGSMGAVYSKTFFSEVAVGVCLLAGVWLLWEARQAGNPRWAWWGGALAGVAILLRSTTAILHVPWLTIFALWPPAGRRPTRWLARALPAWAVPVAAAGGLHLAYNVACWTWRY
ncbi:MAG: glycosyltransferase family 39 protein, partial [Anaerolineae bacterium]|nr:glycosyltransferase family 39 protein [Anaerolineae bacterium]